MQSKSNIPSNLRDTDTNTLVHIICARYDDAEQAEALIELLRRVKHGHDDLAGEDVIWFAGERAFTFTADFRQAFDPVMSPNPSPVLRLVA